MAEALVHESTAQFDALHTWLYTGEPPPAAVPSPDGGSVTVAGDSAYTGAGGERVIVVDLPDDDSELASVTDMAVWAANANQIVGGVERG